MSSASPSSRTRTPAKGILFQDGSITENAEGAEENAGIDDPGPDTGPRLLVGSLGIGGLR